LIETITIPVFEDLSLQFRYLKIHHFLKCLILAIVDISGVLGSTCSSYLCCICVCTRPYVRFSPSTSSTGPTVVGVLACDAGGHGWGRAGGPMDGTVWHRCGRELQRRRVLRRKRRRWVRRRGETDEERQLCVGEPDEQRAAREPHGSHVQGSRARRGHVGESRRVLWQPSAFLA
jgi:hypothetical protein